MVDRLLAGEKLIAGQNLVSKNGAYSFDVQGDGNCVLYRRADGQPLWATNTNRPDAELNMQGDGNCVLYAKSGYAIWSSGTADMSDGWLQLNNDGSLVIIAEIVKDVILCQADPNPPVEPPAPPVVPPKGLTRMSGRLVLDDNGPMNALGTTLMWGLHGCKYERDRVKNHFEWAADNGFRFLRFLGEVRDTDPNAAPFWKDLAIVPVGSVNYPEWPDYEQQVQESTAMACARGIRLEWSIFGTGRDNKTRTVQRWLAGVKPVLVGVQMSEVANESQGFSADGIELRQLASLIRSHLGQDHPLALTAVAEADAAALYNGSAANLFTFHFDRTDGENGWRWVRQPWPGKDFGAFSDNEPKGDHSSVSSDTDPERITMAGVNAFLVGASHHVIHTGAGVRGVDDPARGRVANLWDVPSFAQVCPAMKKWLALLPKDLAQWTKENWHWSGHPFLIEKKYIGDDALGANYGATRCYAATNGNRFITSPIGIMGEFSMTAKTAMQIKLYDWTGSQYDEKSLVAGEVLTFKNRKSAVVIGERR